MDFFSTMVRNVSNVLSTLVPILSLSLREIAQIVFVNKGSSLARRLVNHALMGLTRIILDKQLHVILALQEPLLL